MTAPTGAKPTYAAKPRAAIAILSAAAIAFAVYCVTPEKTPWLPPCPFHWATGLHCPGCGTLRALHQLAHADLMAALKLNSLVVLLFLVMVYALAAEVMEGLQGRFRLRRIRLSPAGSWLALAVLLVFWIARNIPAYPFALLAPH